MLKPIGGGADDLVAVKLHHNALTVAEVRHKSNAIKIDQLASAALPRKLEATNSGRQQDMIRDTIIGLGEQAGFSTRDVGMIVPRDVVQIDMPYIAPAELESEGEDPNFWSEQEPDIGKLQDPYIAFDTLVSSEDDDLTRVVVGYAETAQMQLWSDILLGASLNPVHLELEPVALANYVYTLLPSEERTKAQELRPEPHRQGDRRLAFHGVGNAQRIIDRFGHRRQAGDQRLHHQQFITCQNLWHSCLFTVLPTGQDRRLSGMVGTPDIHRQRKPVKLAFRQIEGANLFGRVLRRDDQERARQGAGFAIHRDDAFLHRLQKGRLRF